MAKKEVKTKAVLFTKGEGQPFELFDGDVTKETFSESGFDKSETTNSFGPEIVGLQSVNTNSTIKIGENDVYSLGFEDGSIYVVGKGFLSGDNKDALSKAVKDLTPKPEPVKKADAPKVPAKAEDKKADPIKEDVKKVEEKVDDKKTDTKEQAESEDKK